jgi:2-haloacid dehalogenase
MNYFPNRNWKSMSTPSIIVFDVNETLIDIESIGSFFERKFGDRKVLREWFNQLILYSNAITLSGYYETFFTLGQGVLEMLGTIYGVSIQPADLEELRRSMLSMPAHKDAPEGLRLLKEAGFRLMTLTNSPPSDGALPWNAPGSIISSSASSVSTVYAGLSLLPRFTFSSPNS